MFYTGLFHRHPGPTDRPSECADAVDALWAHAHPDDGLQHVSALPEAGRIDLLLYLTTRDAPGVPSALRRAHTLIARSHRQSPLLHRRYLPPEPLTAYEGITTG